MRARGIGWRWPAAAAVAAALMASVPAVAGLAGQVDDFEDGTTMGWVEGPVSPNPPGNVSSGGPDGVGDAYLRNASSGSNGSGGRMVMFNQQQWAGDWGAAGIDRIDVWMANLGGTTLYMRLALQGVGAQYCTSLPVALPADGVWRQVSFEISPATMTKVNGFVDLPTALSNVDTVRILSRQGSPGWRGDNVAGALGVDDIQAAGAPPGPPPVPDGSDGQPLLLARLDAAGSTLELSWDVTSCAATDYHVIYGRLSIVDGLGIDGGVCAPGTSGRYTWSGVPSPDLWLLMVGRDGAGTEGSWGDDGTGQPRGDGSPSGVCGVVAHDDSGTCP